MGSHPCCTTGDQCFTPGGRNTERKNDPRRELRCNDVRSLFAWNPITDVHEFRGLGTSYLLEEKIAMMHGLSGKNIKKIYIELENREEILKILAEKKIFDYYELWAYIKKISGMGIEKSLSMLRKGEM